MSVTDEYLANNAAYAQSFAGPLPSPLPLALPLPQLRAEPPAPLANTPPGTPDPGGVFYVRPGTADRDRTARTRSEDERSERRDEAGADGWLDHAPSPQLVAARWLLGTAWQSMIRWNSRGWDPEHPTRS